jgi:uncharacterized protein
LSVPSDFFAPARARGDREVPHHRTFGSVGASGLLADMDRRTIDQDGHLTVSSSVISAETVSPYLGSEIPDYQRLGLDPAAVYMVYRPASELKKAADSFAGKPLLSRHRPVTADDHDSDLVVGSVNNPIWDSKAGVLRAELSVWDADTIRRIQSGEAADLSAAYRYRAIPEAGEFKGQRYALRMVDLQANHVAVIPDGRVDGAVVGDSKMLSPRAMEARAEADFRRRFPTASRLMRGYR